MILQVIISTHRTSMDIEQINNTLLLKVCIVNLFVFIWILKYLLAPTDATLFDFIRMIWQLRIQSIITVTRLFEDGKVTRRLNCQILLFSSVMCLYIYSINVHNIGQMKVKNESMIFEFVLKLKKIMLIILYEYLRSIINQRYESNVTWFIKTTIVDWFLIELNIYTIELINWSVVSFLDIREFIGQTVSFFILERYLIWPLNLR